MAEGARSRNAATTCRACFGPGGCEPSYDQMRPNVCTLARDR